MGLRTTENFLRKKIVRLPYYPEALDPIFGSMTPLLCDLPSLPSLPFPPVPPTTATNTTTAAIASLPPAPSFSSAAGCVHQSNSVFDQTVFCVA